MSRNSIELDFADGEYTFALPLPQLRELQRNTDIGIGGLYRRVTKGVYAVGDKTLFRTDEAEFYALDLTETIRLGLLGGGKGLVNGEVITVTPAIANRLLAEYVFPQPLVESWKLIYSILGACIIGYDPPKKAEPAEARAPRKKQTKKATSTTT